MTIPLTPESPEERRARLKEVAGKLQARASQPLEFELVKGLPSFKDVKFEVDAQPRQVRLDTIAACSAACLGPDELIAMADGRQKRIADVCVGDWVLSYALDGKIRPSLVTGAGQTSPLRETLVIQTSLGALRCTPDHRILTEIGWREAGTLQIGDRLIGSAQRQPSELDARAARKTAPECSSKQYEDGGRSVYPSTYWRKGAIALAGSGMASQTGGGIEHTGGFREETRSWKSDYRAYSCGVQQVGEGAYSASSQYAETLVVGGVPRENDFVASPTDVEKGSGDAFGAHEVEQPNASSRGSCERNDVEIVVHDATYDRSSISSACSTKSDTQVDRRRTSEGLGAYANEQSNEESRCGSARRKGPEGALADRSNALRKTLHTEGAGAEQRRSEATVFDCASRFSLYGRRGFLDWALSERPCSESGFYLEVGSFEDSPPISFELLASRASQSGRCDRNTGLSLYEMACACDLGRRDEEEVRRAYGEDHGVAGTAIILSIEESDSIPVYDIETWPYHNFIAQGIVVHNCLFCQGYSYTEDRHRDGQVMSFAQIVKIVKEIASWPQPLTELIPVNYGEFFMRKDWHEVLLYIADHLPQTRIWIPTNGSVLTPQMVERLAGIRTLKGVNFSVNAFFQESYVKLMKLPPMVMKRAEEAAVELHNLRPDITIWASMVYNPVYLTELERDLFEQKWAAHPFIKPQILRMTSWNDMALSRPQEPVTLPCRSIFSDMVIMNDGNLTSCCFDAMGEVKLGQMSEASLLELWRGGKFEAFRKIHLEGRRAQVPLCRGCSFA